MASLLRVLFNRVSSTHRGSKPQWRALAGICRTRKGLRPMTTAPSTISTASSQRLTPRHDCVILNWGTENAWSKFHYVWLRDNCMCPDCLHPVTNQRLLDSLHVPLDVKPTRVYATEEALHVQWEDGHLSDYPMKWMMRNSYQQC